MLKMYAFNITDCLSPLTFKKYLKTYLFSLSLYSKNQLPVLTV